VLTVPDFVGLCEVPTVPDYVRRCDELTVILLDSIIFMFCAVIFGTKSHVHAEQKLVGGERFVAFIPQENYRVFMFCFMYSRNYI
jgi:hypothetical protein